ncbi:hypothetical protein FB45DRAFT_915171 [Roridomyces roridus]|uniref:Uncharacterized protein n=1 Tax=Roridomyces roridus TaxID=1738132 RepID=A0AAD7BTH5_9AGAR|nr:hypothetical protein FB45DRAFT_915171 [Roridomyces roridus]
MPASRSPRAMSTSQFERLTYTVREANKHQAAIACYHARSHQLHSPRSQPRPQTRPHDQRQGCRRLSTSICRRPSASHPGGCHLSSARCWASPQAEPRCSPPPADAPVSGPFSTISISVEPINLRAWPVLMPRLSLLPDDLFTLAPRRVPEPPVIPVIPDVPFDEEEADAFFASHELGYPESGVADYAESSSSSSDASSVSSGSSSSGPVTPPDAEMTLGSTLPSKRRLEPELVVDKRPKYDRKAWTRDPVRSF